MEENIAKVDFIKIKNLGSVKALNSLLVGMPFWKTVWQFLKKLNISYHII